MQDCCAAIGVRIPPFLPKLVFEFICVRNIAKDGFTYWRFSFPIFLGVAMECQIEYDDINELDWNQFPFVFWEKIEELANEKFWCVLIIGSFINAQNVKKNQKIPQNLNSFNIHIVKWSFFYVFWWKNEIQNLPSKSIFEKKYFFLKKKKKNP